MRRPADVNDAFNFVRRGVDQRDGIRSDRNDSQRLGIGRVTESVNKKLSFVERTQRAGHRIAKSYHAEQLVLGRINHRNRVRSLIGRVNAIVTRDRNVRPCPGRLLCHRRC